MGRRFWYGLVFLLLAPTQVVLGVSGAEFAIYDGPGAWQDGVTAFEHFLDWKGVSHERISYAEVNSVDLKNYYDAIFFPGGYAAYYVAYINEAGLQHIRDLVSAGGGYFGTCAGAYFASDSIVWEGDRLDYPLDLFQGLSIGSIHEIAPWPSYTMTTLEMNAADRVSQYEPDTEVMLYYGGQYFVPYEGTEVDVSARWADYGHEPAIIHFDYGNGRVLLCGSHPEIEEDSDRDGIDFADELDDQGTDWYFLWSAIDWVLGRPISHPKFWINEFHYDNAGEDQGEFVEVVLPDWYSSLENVQLTLYDSDGRVYAEHSISEFEAGSHLEDLQLYYLDIPGLVDGPGGLALSCNGELIQFLSYEGELTALDGPAAGFRSQDVGVHESGNEPPGQSLQEEGEGTEVVDFCWSGPEPQTRGFANGDQALPVELAALSVTLVGSELSVSWTTASERDNLGFQLWVGPSRAGPFRLLASYESRPALRGGGTRTGRHRYSFRCEVDPAGTSWLKLVSVASGGETRAYGPYRIANAETPIPETPVLENPQPNPSSGQTRVRARFPVLGGNAAIVIYDVRGRLVRRLWQGQAGPGELTVNWDGCDDKGQPVASGVYLLELRAAGATRTVRFSVRR